MVMIEIFDLEFPLNNNCFNSKNVNLALQQLNNKTSKEFLPFLYQNMSSVNRVCGQLNQVENWWRPSIICQFHQKNCQIFVVKRCNCRWLSQLLLPAGIAGKNIFPGVFQVHLHYAIRKKLQPDVSNTQRQQPYTHPRVIRPRPDSRYRRNIKFRCHPLQSRKGIGSNHHFFCCYPLLHDVLSCNFYRIRRLPATWRSLPALKVTSSQTSSVRTVARPAPWWPLRPTRQE